MLEETRQEAPKDRWGRYLVTTPDGKQRGYTRVTTIAKAPDDEAALKQWANRMVVTGLINAPIFLRKHQQNLTTNLR
jgi:hypothetical protein